MCSVFILLCTFTLTAIGIRSEVVNNMTLVCGYSVDKREAEVNPNHPPSLTSVGVPLTDHC